MSNLFERTKFQKLWRRDSTDGGGSLGGSTYLDMAGWEGAYIIIKASSHTNTTGAVVIRASSDASTGGAFTVTKTSGMDFSTGAQEYLALDCYRPLKRYLSVLPQFTSGLVSGWALLYGGRRQGSTEAKTGILKGFTVALTS